MDAREAMSLGNHPSYYMHTGGGGNNVGFQMPPGFRPNTGIISSQSNNNVGGSTISCSTVNVEHGHTDYGHGGHGHGHGISVSCSPGVVASISSEGVKKKRGRPRKYRPDNNAGHVSLGLSPMSPTADSTPGSGSSSQKRARGRPPGTGRKQQLASLGIFLRELFCTCK